ncbi:MAG: hypothetical protein AUK47_19690 [Deltaproteobacteria bacterium CG2_30_63_29]|nr:MAG: hypothetical protein AUK47_19690 [Deltaproteobacteria bacterium CG2_30_63_29]PIW02676.1 MAG: hypothetical protein COW42_00360 [Deltaproteobacteria bacterium CG17_big_fil_post_rev_8_21_14_2_50_63_7]PJB33773.1 MAG: hypothetical protein CO108_30190 [Deltaproteobacteria bacterium CG_4_9_14_3_um_filter_63_12]
MPHHTDTQLDFWPVLIKQKETMNAADQRQYLGNLIAIATADAVVLMSENAFLAQVCANIGAPPELLVELLENRGSDIELRPLSRYSTRILCLEDMIELAMIDGDVALDEKKVIFVVAQKSGISKDIVLTLIHEARQRLEAAESPVVE